MIGVISREKQLAGYGSHIKDPGKDDIADISENAVQSLWNKMVVSFLEKGSAKLSKPLLEASEGADPAAEGGTEENGNKKDDGHKHDGGLMYLLHIDACGYKLICRCNTAKRA